jgi:hypothetical protein
MLRREDQQETTMTKPTVQDVLDSLTEDESDELLRRLDEDREWKAFIQGWSAAIGFVRDRKAVAIWMGTASTAEADAFIDDLKVAVSAVLYRHGHDVAGQPSRDLLRALGGLVGKSPDGLGSRLN